MTNDPNERFDRLLERMANGQAPAGKKQPEPPKDDDKREGDDLPD